MTDTAKPALTAERFIAKLRRREATKAKRLHEALVAAEYRFNRRESTWRCDQLAEVIEAERPPAVTMAQALGLVIDAQPAQPPPAAELVTADKLTDPEHRVPASPPAATGGADDVPAALMTPLTKERLAVGRK